jgi:NADH-quinone oxidoreductase subunit M
VGRLFTGPATASMQALPDLTRAEMAAAGLLAAGIVGIGFYPGPAVTLVGTSVARLARLFGG